MCSWLCVRLFRVTWHGFIKCPFLAWFLCCVCICFHTWYKWCTDPYFSLFPNILGSSRWRVRDHLARNAWNISLSVGYVLKFGGWCISLTLPTLHCYSLKTIISLLLFQDIVAIPKWHWYICVRAMPILFYSI